LCRSGTATGKFTATTVNCTVQDREPERLQQATANRAVQDPEPELDKGGTGIGIAWNARIFLEMEVMTANLHLPTPPFPCILFSPIN